MRPSYPLGLASLMCLVVQCVASPIPMFRGKSKAPSSSSRGNVSGRQALVEDHQQVMSEACLRLSTAAFDKVEEYKEANKLRLKGHPILSSKEVHTPSYSNKGYIEAIRYVDAHHAGLEDQHGKLIRHMNNLANHGDQREIGDLVEQADQMHQCYQKGLTWAHDHIEDDEEVHDKIHHIIESEGTLIGSNMRFIKGRHGFQNAKVGERWDEVDRISKRIPNRFPTS